MKTARYREASFTFDADERIVEGRTVNVRDKGKVYALHVLILEGTSGSGKKGRHAQVEAPAGVPIPGKGENSWDCGDDNIWGASFAARTVKEAVKKFMDDVRETRRERA